MAEARLNVVSDYGPVVQTFNAINKEIDVTEENVLGLGKSSRAAFDQMTNEAKQYGKQVSGNVQDFAKLKQATREQVQTIQQLTAARKASNNPAQIAFYNKKIDEARSKIKALNEDQKKGSKENQEETKKSIGLITQLLDKQRKLTEARDRSNDPALIKKYNKYIDETKSKLEGLTSTQKKAASSGGFLSGGIASVLGGNLLFAGVAKLKQYFGEAVDVQVQFQQSLQNLSAITGASGQDLVFYGEEAIKMGRNIKGGATAAVEAFKLIGSAKPELLSNKEALVEVTDAAVTLSQASGLTLPDAARNLGIALNAFEEPAGKAGNIINVLAGAAKFGAQEIPFVTDALSKFGGVAKNAGVGIEESAAAIEILGAKIPEASIVGTNLRGVLIVLQTEAAKQGRAFKGLGAELDLLGPKVKDITFLEQTFGKENLLAAQTLISQREELAKMTKEITGTSSAFEQAATNTATFAQAILEADNAWSEFLLALTDGKIGSIFQGTVEGWTQALRDFASVLRGTFLSDENVQALVQFGNVTETQAKRLDQLGLSIKNLNNLSKSEKETIDYLRATDIYLNNISTAEGANRVLNNLGLEVKKLGAFYAAGTITLEEYTIRLKILQSQVNKGIELNKKIASSVSKNEIKEELGLIERLQQEIQTLTDLRVKAGSVGEVNKLSSEIKSKQAQLDALLGKANEDIKRAKDEFERAILDLRKRTSAARIDALGGQERIDAQLKFNEEELQITKDHLLKLGQAVNKNYQLSIEQQMMFNELSNQLQRKAAEESIKIEIDKQNALADQSNKKNQLGISGLNAEEQGQINAVNSASQPNGVSDVAFETEKQNQLLNIQLYYAVQRSELQKQALADQRNNEVKSLDLQLQQIGDSNDSVTQEKRAAIIRDLDLLEKKYQIEGEVVKNEVDKIINDINAKKGELNKDKPFSLQELFGMSDAEVQGLQTAVAQVTEFFDAFYDLQFELVNQQIQLSQSKIDKYTEEIQTLENKLNREIELNSEGKANNIDKLNDEIELKQEQKKKEEAVEKAALERRKKLQKEKLNLDTILQSSNLAVAATQIFAATAGGGPVGVALAIVAIGAMLGAFIITKQKAYAAINASDGTEGFKEGVIGLNGPGTETSDSINANLSKGESVITAKKTKQHRKLLEGIHYEDEGLMKAGILDLIKNTGIKLSDDLPEVINTKKEIIKQNEINAYLKTDNSKLEKQVKEMKEVLDLILIENKEKNYSDQEGNLIIKKGSHKEIFKNK